MSKNNSISKALLAGTLMSIIALVCVWSLSGCKDKNGSGHEEPKKAKKEQQLPGHEGHDHSKSIPVTKEQVDRLGIKISRAVRGEVRQEVRIPGEIKVNTDQMAHVTPRAAGIVREVGKVLGDSVTADEPLAWIESDKLAEAKLNFYAKESEVGCCEIVLPRAKAIFENVARLSALLRKEAPEKDIRKLDGREMGKYRGLLMTSYDAYLAARTNQQREVSLHEKKISSGRELLTAETAMRQAKTKLDALLDTARYETLIEYTEAVQQRQVAVFDAVAAEKRLRLRGADDKTVADLRTLIPQTASLKPCLCDNPNCKSGKLPAVAETLRKDGRFASYALRAPFAGTVIAKHIVAGESVDETAEAFTVANLNSVWVDLAVSQDNIALIRAGYDLTVHLPDGTESEAKITFVSPIVASDSRTAMARAVLPNPDGKFRPGTFVDAAVVVPSKKDAIAVPKAAVQLVNDHPCVFVWASGDFKLQEVETGVTDGDQIEILSGLEVGQAVASAGAFHLKAEYVKSRAGDTGAHAGHSH